MDNEIKAGDVVQLKSGGPLMTVAEAERSDEKKLCVWIPGADHGVMSDWFDASCLKVWPQAKEE